MGTGISMSSVNKIKELAESGDYSLALDILEHQDLTKSLSPQFIRICGEVYYENNRFDEARAAFVKAHSMAPVGNRIIFSIIKLYLSMGLYSLAEKYYDIYKFNQTERDAGTFRIEYMIGKAKRLSPKELYGVLISANELESDDKWDYEMLLLYSCMDNKDRLKSEISEFRVNHKSSPLLDKLDILLEDKSYAESRIYCYPEKEQQDDKDSQNDTREFERRVLDEDELRIHPKAPEILVMVEDNEPVSNSVKFKQMLLKSKEKKAIKKEEKESSKEDKKEKSGNWLKNRLSKKDEEAALEIIAETENKDIDKDKLLDEVMQGDNDFKALSSEGEETSITDNDIKEIVEENNEDINLDVMSEELFDEAINDFEFQNEDEYDSVVVVNTDMPDVAEETELTEVTEEAEVEEETEVTEEAEVEEETEVTEEAEVEEESEVTEETEVEEESEVTEEVEVEEEFEALEETETEEETEISETVEYAEAAEEPEISESAEYAETAEESESAESLDSDNSVDIGKVFDIDDAFDSLNSYDIEDEDSFNQAGEGDIDIQLDEEESFEPEELEDIPLEEPEEIQLDEEESFEPEELEDIPSEEPEEQEDISLEEPEDDSVSDVKDTDVVSSENKLDFPVFRTSLFPEYNNGKPYVEETTKPRANIVQEEENMSENLLKEQELINETDELLARLGIELGTKYSSNTDYFNLHSNNADIEDEKQTAQDESGVADEKDIISEAASNGDDANVDTQNDTHKKSKEKKKFSLKKR